MSRGFALVDQLTGEVTMSKVPFPGPIEAARKKLVKEYGSAGEDADDLMEDLCVELVPLTSAHDAVYRSLKPKSVSRLTLTGAEYFRKLVRDMSRMDRFDRIGLAIAQNGKYGTISGRLAEFENEGYIEKNGKTHRYDDAKLRAGCPSLNPLVNRVRADDPPRVSSEVYVRTRKWRFFEQRWRRFLGTICSVCFEPQKETDAGKVCKNGHGGAPSAAETL